MPDKKSVPSRKLEDWCLFRKDKRKQSLEDHTCIPLLNVRAENTCAKQRLSGAELEEAMFGSNIV